jgi:hypothetical protein
MVVWMFCVAGNDEAFWAVAGGAFAGYMAIVFRMGGKQAEQIENDLRTLKDQGIDRLEEFANKGYNVEEDDE